MRLPKLILVCVLTACWCVLAAGCEKPLFPENTPRSQYDRYSLLRGQQRPAKEETAYGAEVPALRERLQPLEQGY